ncbi:hypothetical protein F5882DRAFT_491181 [Hyaloscypha sp. PMI_1271]|nr:hypothetical protein F5882DRAFT_491181 [Hyaloscypha sp. PMI_1271]
MNPPPERLHVAASPFGAKRKGIQRTKTLFLATSDPRTQTHVEGERFRLEDLDIDEKRICDELNCHLHFKVKEGYEMKNLPKFHDLTRYGVRADQELGLWKSEVRRLASVVRSPEPPILKASPEWFGRADSEGYNRLHIIGLAVCFALDVCLHDNELVMLEFQPPLANVETFSTAHKRLLRNFNPNEGTTRYDRNIKLDKHNSEAYQTLVNYLTASLARLLIRTMKGQFWVDNCLSTVAKFAAKLKVVGADLPRAICRAFEAQKEFQVRMGQRAKSQAIIQSVTITSQRSGDGEENNDNPMAKQQAVLQTDLDTSGSRYFMVMDAFYHSIGMLLAASVVGLVWNEGTDQPADIFETSATVYDTGLRGTKTQLCRERDGSIGVAGERNVIHCAGMAFDACREIWDKLPSTPAPPGPYTSLDWNWTELTDSGNLGPSSPRSGKLTVMSDVITALVPYLMFCGVFPTQLAHMTRVAILISDPTEPVEYYQHGGYLAVAQIRTSRHRTLYGAQFQSVFESPMAQQRALAGVTGDEWERNSASRALRSRYTATNEKFRNALEQVDNWIIDERSIIVTSVLYSWVVLVGIGIVVLGGVALVAMRDSIPNVDPSNLTVLVWTAAGFAVVYAKSRRVEDWPWRDFLRGRVVCRSVTEVNAVTKVEPQLLLAILLRYETRMFLKKRGPFNNLFDRKSEDGFSIDVPPLVETAAAGGHIFIKVDSLNGPALVGLQGHIWGNYESVSPKDRTREGSSLICRDFDDPARYRLTTENGKGEDASGGSRDLPLPLYPICTNELNWYRVQGIFSEKALFG